MGNNTVEVLRNESKQVERQIDLLTETKQVLDNAINHFSKHSSGFGIHRSSPQQATKKKSTKKTTTSPKRKSMSDGGQSTMEMIRTVLQNSGEPLSAQEIKTRVLETFGTEPSKSYAQMLYKRAKSGTGFFKSGRKYGAIPQAAIAKAA